MNTNRDPRELAFDLLDRSVCNVQVAAVVSDKHGIFSWGRNYELHGKGIHAEHDAFRHANRKRLCGARLTVIARRRESGRIICARPCERGKVKEQSHTQSCMALAIKYEIRIVEYTVRGGSWEILRL